jgi:hypothetical protein
MILNDNLAKIYLNSGILYLVTILTLEVARIYNLDTQLTINHKTLKHGRKRN